MNILYALQVLLGFGFVIAIHELGHFLAAKRVGITCPAFSIGFPLPVWTKKGWKGYNIFRYTWRGTEYRLGWIPFGGYVTMTGQSDSAAKLDEASANDETDYRNKSYWEKTQVLLGGVAMNAITAVIGFIIAFQIGVTFIEPTVGRVSSNSQAWLDNEIQVGDRIVRVNERDVVDFEDVMYAGIFDGGDSIRVVVERPKDGVTTAREGGETEEVEFTLSLDPHPVFGILMPSINAKHRVVITRDEAALFPAELGEDRPRDGDEIISVDGRRVRNVDDVMGFLDVARGEVEIGFRRGFHQNARDWTVRYTPRRHFFSDSSLYRAGISHQPPPYVGRMQRGGPAEQAGLQTDDRIVGYVSEDGTEHVINSFGDLGRIVDEHGGRNLTLMVERGEERVQIDVTPVERDHLPGRYQLGMLVSSAPTEGLTDAERVERARQPLDQVTAWGVRPDSPAEQAGMRPGDRILSMHVGGVKQGNPSDGKFDEVAYSRGMLTAAAEDGPVELRFEVERDGERHTVRYMTDPAGPDSAAYMEIATAELRSDPVTYGLLESVNQGFYHSKKVGYKILMTLSGLFTGRVKIWHLGGPVVIAKRSYSLAQWGVGTLIFFLAFISINLAIINLLPIPALDGGQWLIVTIEAIRGKPLPEPVMMVVGYVGLLFIGGLMLFVLANDLLTVFVRGWV
jgi:regulator of sigma E protease